MTLEHLEDRFQAYIAAHPERLADFRELASAMSAVQGEMRELVEAWTAVQCPVCTSSCCRMMPVDGWFTESDYFAFRMRHAAPFALRGLLARPGGTDCRFLGPSGCALPKDFRPIPCVKVNCGPLQEALVQRGLAGSFECLAERLDSLQRETWSLLP